MYTQLLKEALLEIEDDDKKSIKNLVDYCRLKHDISEVQIKKIELEYRAHTPIWWYTAPYFMCSALNHWDMFHASRTKDHPQPTQKACDSGAILTTVGNLNEQSQ
ncbi:unnamed protein product [Rotaria sp. Silwood2]|nr:unnamed protein product [Rotaria sp. Silwood2]CAF3196871.1 unnamed protein product [Rotaria sp. Silwood2]CAF4102519.1 unnamed protein product [Rotaria sp. Silwood2]CAF4120208.1 unnamed protein product [Rotaria sp. Silwood2]